MRIRVRQAKAEDAPELARLRAVMVNALGMDPGHEEAKWRRRAEEWFALRLRDREDDFACFVADAGDRLVASCVVWLTEHIPKPGNPSGLRGYVDGMCTELEWQGRGLGRQLLLAGLNWLRERGMNVVELNASREGEGLYRSVGFQDSPYPALALTFE
jgi:GNAT superfamily N-acetyltransferase